MLKIAREMEIYRRETPHGSGDRTCGLFDVPARKLRIIASSGEGWDHVSVSTPDRCPTWDEMQWVRSKFFDDADTVVQFSPPAALHINCHPYCLHLWRPHERAIELPPAWMIA
jgi:hypothetical protein